MNIKDGVQKQENTLIRISKGRVISYKKPSGNGHWSRESNGMVLLIVIA